MWDDADLSQGMGQTRGREAADKSENLGVSN